MSRGLYNACLHCHHCRGGAGAYRTNCLRSFVQIQPDAILGEINVKQDDVYENKMSLYVKFSAEVAITLQLASHGLDNCVLPGLIIIIVIILLTKDSHLNRVRLSGFEIHRRD